MAVTILDIDSSTFSIDGITYLKHFMSVVNNDNVQIMNVYDSDVILVIYTDYSEFTIDGGGFASAILLQAALVDVLFRRVDSSVITDHTLLTNIGVLTHPEIDLTVSQLANSNTKDFNVVPHFTMKAISSILRGLSTEPKGIFVYGDSMKDVPSGFLLGSLKEFGIITGGMGSMPYFNETNDGTIGIGTSVTLTGATTVAINAQEGAYGQTEWVDDIYVLAGASDTVEFKQTGGHPTNAVTKIYVLTEVGGGTYTIQKNTNSGGWVNDSTGNSANAAEGMLVHTFDNLADGDNIGYQLLWESGIVKTLYPCIYKDDTAFVHLVAGTGGADSRKQASVPSVRVRFILQDMNVVLATSSHRYEVANTTELQADLDLTDVWWDGLPMNVYYEQQWAKSSGSDTDIRAENEVIRTKALDKGYLMLDAYNELGGLTGTVLGGYDDPDPIHLTKQAWDILGSIFLEKFSLNTFRALVKAVNADTLGGFAGSEYLRSNDADFYSGSALTINDDKLLIFGTGNRGNIKFNSGVPNRVEYSTNGRLLRIKSGTAGGIVDFLDSEATADFLAGVKLSGVPTYADDTAAGVGGLTTNYLYKTATGEIRIKT